MRFRPHSVDCDQQLGAIWDPVRGPVMAQAQAKRDFPEKEYSGAVK
jgi:hypothetical protein